MQDGDVVILKSDKGRPMTVTVAGKLKCSVAYFDGDGVLREGSCHTSALRLLAAKQKKKSREDEGPNAVA